MIDFADLEAWADSNQFAGPLAQSATLRGQPVRIILNHNVEIEGEYGQYAATVSVAEFPASAAPTKGDDIYIPAEGKGYILDAALKGRPGRWIVRPA